MLPLLLNVEQAAEYTGLSVDNFNQYVRPHVRVLSFGPRTLRVPRIDLEQWVQQYDSAGASIPAVRRDKCVNKEVLLKEVTSTTTKGCIKGSAYAAALERVTYAKQSK